MKLELALLLSSLLVAACAHKPAVVAAPAAAPAATAESLAANPAPPPAAAAAPAEQTCSQDDDCPSDALCLGARCVRMTPEVVLAECGRARVHFAFNAWVLRDEDKPVLERIARCVRADPSLRVTVEGNADERGTEEYNLQLGAKRAAQVTRYLSALGVPGARLQSISYGFENPLCTEHNEACWATNRRAGVKAQRAAP